jgi:hypothetical protein
VYPAFPERGASSRGRRCFTCTGELSLDSKLSTVDCRFSIRPTQQRAAGRITGADSDQQNQVALFQASFFDGVF